jgi:phage regulator Rha-like protein
MKDLATIASITSREIAELVGSRHDKVKQSIERLADRGVITQPPSGSESYKDGSGRTVVTGLYIFTGDQGKRDSIVVVAQLSPEFTARLVDRWQELEAARNQPAIPRTYAEALQLAADQARLIEVQTQQIEAAKPAVEFHERVAVAEDAHTIDEAAKIFRVGPNKLRKWMREIGILRIDGLPAAEMMNRGYFRVIEKTIEIGHGFKLYRQSFVTGKGMQFLQRRIDRSLMGVEL